MGKRKSKLKSNCCNAPIKVGEGIGDFSEKDKACTLYAVCSKCNKPCDIKSDTRKVWTINPSTKVKKDDRKKFKDKLTKTEIENYRKNEDF
jgi:hypothetical protein